MQHVTAPFRDVQRDRDCSVRSLETTRDLVSGGFVEDQDKDGKTVGLVAQLGDDQVGVVSKSQVVMVAPVHEHCV